MNREEIKNKAKELMKGNMWKIFGIMLLVSILSSIASEIIVKLFAVIGVNLTYTIGNTKIAVFRVTCTTQGPYKINVKETKKLLNINC